MHFRRRPSGAVGRGFPRRDRLGDGIGEAHPLGFGWVNTRLGHALPVSCVLPADAHADQEDEREGDEGRGEDYGEDGRFLGSRGRR